MQCEAIPDTLVLLQQRMSEFEVAIPEDVRWRLEAERCLTYNSTKKEPARAERRQCSTLCSLSFVVQTDSSG